MHTDMPELVSVKDTGKRVTLTFADELVRNGKLAQGPYSSKDRPLADFEQALAAFGKPARWALTLMDEAEIRILEVAIDRSAGEDGDELNGVIAKVVITTRGTTRVTNASPFLSASEIELLGGLVAELEAVAEAYWRGERKQLEIGDDGLTDEQRARAGADWADETDDAEQPELQPA